MAFSDGWRCCVLCIECGRSAGKRLPIIPTALIVYLTNCIMDDLITIKMIIIGDSLVHPFSAIASTLSLSLTLVANWLHYDCSRHADVIAIGFRFLPFVNVESRDGSRSPAIFEFFYDSIGPDFGGNNLLHISRRSNPAEFISFGTIMAVWHTSYRVQFRHQNSVSK